MKKSLTLTLPILVISLCLGSFAEAAIYISGQLYAGNVLNITGSSYSEASVTLTEDSVVNIYYQDKFVPFGPGYYQPAINPNIIAQENSVVNFVYPQTYNFSLWCGDDKQMNVYSALQIDRIAYPSIAPAFCVMRDYDTGTPHVLEPLAGYYHFEGNGEMNFLPEPATFLLLLIGIAIRMKVRRK